MIIRLLFSPILFIFFFLGISSKCFAQEKGFLVLRTNDTLKGNFHIKDGPIIKYWKNEQSIKENINISTIKQIVTNWGVYKVFYFDESPVLLEEVISGNLSLYKTLGKIGFLTPNGYFPNSSDVHWGLDAKSAKQQFILKNSLLYPISFNHYKRDLRRLLDTDQFKKHLSFFSQFSYKDIPVLIDTYNNPDEENQLEYKSLFNLGFKF